jgi:hypothetical protein
MVAAALRLWFAISEYPFAIGKEGRHQATIPSLAAYTYKCFKKIEFEIIDYCL